MNEVKYWQTLKESFIAYKNNLNLIWYWFVSILIILIMVPIALLEYILLLALGGQNFFEMTGNVNFPLIIVLGIFIIIDVVIYLILLSMSSSLMLGMIYDVAKGKKLNSKNIVPYAKKWWTVVLGTKLFLLVFMLAIMGLLGIIWTLLNLISPVLGAIALIIFIPLLIAFIIFFWIFTLFLGPIIVLKNKKTIATLKIMINYVKKNFTHTFFTWGVMILCVIILIFAFLILSIPILLPIGLIHGLESTQLNNVANAIDIVFRIIGTLIGLGLGIFTFKCFMKLKA